MDQLYKFVKKFFFLTPVKTVIMVIPSYLFVIFVLANNIQNVAISSLAYILSAAKVISLTTAMVSMFSLESAMLAQFADASQTAFKKIMTECTGGVICVIVIGMAVYMMFRSTKEIRKI